MKSLTRYHIKLYPGFNLVLKQLLSLKGSRLLERYSYSLFKILTSVYPDYEWLPWKFTRIPENGWKEGAKQFMDMVTKELKMNTLDDWYNVSKEDIKKFKGGNRILTPYNGSMFKLLTSVYPEHGWLPWRFHRASHYLSDINNCKIFVDSIAKKLNIKEKSDWYNVKAEVK